MALVFKVKFQDTLRRWVVTEALNSDSFLVTFGQLEAKIRELFQFPPFTSFVITYVDKDNDVITLADDQDVIDACVMQRLNPLRLDVHVLGGNSSTSEHALKEPRSSEAPPMSAENLKIEAFLNALFPRATADAVKGFMQTYTPFIDPKLPATACLAKIENAFKDFLNGLAAHHHGDPKSGVKGAPHHPKKQPCPFMPNPYCGDANFHWGIECDGCGMSPIEGSRYKSTKETNYDLCASCFNTIGNESDYEKLDRPAHRLPPHGHYRADYEKLNHPADHLPPPKGYLPPPKGYLHPSFRTGVHDLHPGNRYVPPCLRRGPRSFMAPPGCRASFARGPHGWKPSHPFAGHQSSGFSADDEHGKLDARFVKDVTIFDGTELSPGTKFTKIWRMSNIGTLTWPERTYLVHIGGDVLCTEETVALELTEGGLPCGEEVEVSVDLIAPEKAGRYVSHWRLTAPSGQKFGHRLWVVIHVVAQGEHSPQFQASLRDGENSFEVNKEAMDVELDGANTLTLDVDLDGANKVAVDVVVDCETAVIEQVAVEKAGLNDREDANTTGLNDREDANTITYPDPTSYVSDAVVDCETAVIEPVAVEKAGLNDREDANTITYPDPTSCDSEYAAEKHSEMGADTKFEVDGFALVEKPTESPDWFDVSDQGIVESESFHTPERPKEGEGEVKEVGQETVVQALETMGFTDRDLNVSILQSRNFELQDTVDDLLVAAGWDGVFKDLEEMGFNNKATNIRLLVKNKGSLKQTVKDLVKLEKEVVEG